MEEKMATEEYLDKIESFNSWNAYMSHADSYALKNDLYQRYFKNVI